MGEIIGGDASPTSTGNLTIESILGDLGIVPRKPDRKPEPPTTTERVLAGVSYVAEFFAFVLLFISFIAVGIAIFGIAGMLTLGSFYGLGVVNSAAITVAGGISGSAIMSAAISIRRLAQEMRTPMAMKRIMKAAGVSPF